MAEMINPGISHPALFFHHSGKVRETYRILGCPDLLLVLATDRISTHNVMHLSHIPEKGKILTALTIHWLREVFSDFEHHLVASGREIYRYLPDSLRVLHQSLHHRAIIVRRLHMTEREFIFRRYLVGAGSLYKAYQAGEDPYGLNLPPGLPVMHRFEKLIFTPTDKSEHDNPLNAATTRRQYPQETETGMRLFSRGEGHLASKGIVPLDSKFEMSGSIVADEVLTPDSSRFANADDIKEGEDPPWLDKEFVRAAAVKQWAGGPKTPLSFSNDVIEGTMSRYGNMLHRITDYSLAEWCEGERYDYAA